MNRDELIREMRNTGANWPAVVIVYAVIVATMIGSAMGKKLGPLRYTMHLAPLVHFCNAIGLHLMSFYDDNNTFVPRISILIDYLGTFLRKILAALHIVIKEEKSNLAGGLALRNILGFLVDLHTFTIDVPDDKLKHLIDLIEKLLQDEHTTPRILAELRGRIESLRPALKTAPPSLHNITATIVQAVPTLPAKKHGMRPSA